jgi:hypothetical protein
MVREKETTIIGGPSLTFVRFVLPAGEAVSAPPLSATLGQIQVNSADFCKQFNLYSQSYEPGTLLNVHLFKQTDGTFFIIIRGISLPFLFFQAVTEDKLIPVEVLYDIFKIFMPNPKDEFFSAKQFFGSLRAANFKILLLFACPSVCIILNFFFQ